MPEPKPKPKHPDQMTKEEKAEYFRRNPAPSPRPVPPPVIRKRGGSPDRRVSENKVYRGTR